MDINNNDFVLCDDNWDQIQQVSEVRKHLERMRLWFQADDKPDLGVTSAIDTSIQALDDLFLVMTALQIRLISNLK